jgi:glucosamine kinase
MRYVLGLDGGGSKTVCLAADESGRLLGYGRGGPANTAYNDRREALASVRDAVDGALATAGLAGEQIAALCASIPMGPETLQEAVQAYGIGLTVRAAEGETAREAACPWVSGHVGVTVDGGTGSLARGWSRDGREVGTGGWGCMLGDEGSGYWIGLQAMIAIVQAHDGRSEPTLLTPAVLEHLGVTDVAEMATLLLGLPAGDGAVAHKQAEFMIDSGRVIEPGAAGAVQGAAASTGGLLLQHGPRRESLRRHGVAGLCPVVVSVARRGDGQAAEILRHAGHELGRLAAAVIRRLRMGTESFAVVPFGGVFKAGEPVLGPFAETIFDAAPRAEIVHPRFGPEAGAVLLAIERIGIGVEADIIAMFERSAERMPELVR